MSANVVEVRGLSRRFGSKVALDAIDFTAAAGFVPSSVLFAHLWGLAAATLVGMAYLAWWAVTERTVGLASVGAALAVWLGAALWLSQSGGVWDPDLPAGLRALFTSLTLLPVAAVAVAPWSFACIRHR